MSIAITGATGRLGSLVIAGLLEDGHAGRIVALARSPERVATSGVSAREADYDRPETLRRALAGVDTLLLVSGNAFGRRVAQHRAVIEAAMASNVAHIFYTSVLSAEASPFPFAREHCETEELIEAFGLPHTFLRRGQYTEVYTDAVPATVKAGILVDSAGRRRIASATRADYAEAAVAVLTSRGHENRTYELTGDRTWSFRDLAEEIRRQTGAPIRYRELSRRDHAAFLVSTGHSKTIADAMAWFDADASSDVSFAGGRDLAHLIWRPTTSLSEAVAATLAPGRWSRLSIDRRGDANAPGGADPFDAPRSVHRRQPNGRVPGSTDPADDAVPDRRNWFDSMRDIRVVQ